MRATEPVAASTSLRPEPERSAEAGHRVPTEPNEVDGISHPPATLAGDTPTMTFKASQADEFPHGSGSP